MTIARTEIAAEHAVWSRTVCIAGASVAMALTLGASGHALAQCVGTYSANSGSGIHSTPSANAGLHSASTTPSAHAGSSSCSTGGSMTRTQSVHLNVAHLKPAIAKPAVGGGSHVAAAQRENTHSMTSKSGVAKH